MKVRVVGIHKTKGTLADGSKRTYYYAWRGGPRIKADPNSREFLAEYLRLTHGRADRQRTNTFAELVIGFENSAEFEALGERTRADYADHFKYLLAEFADLPIPALEERGIRSVIKQWHGSMSNAPRRADMRLSALSRVLSWAVDEEILQVNKALGIKKLSEGTRRDIIWTPEQLTTFINQAPDALSQAVMLALWTGQRQGDLLRLTWSAYDGRTIALRQRKGKQKVRFVVSRELKTMLDAMPRRAVTILTTGKGVPWGSGFGSYFRKWQAKLKITGVTFHDLRGTFITVAYHGGYSVREIARVSGHSERECERIINTHYLAADLTGEVADYRVKK